MGVRVTLELTPEQYEELDRMRRTHAKPYVRERAAALIKVSEGKTARWVAAEGLLVPREPDTVSAWVSAYRERGVDSLLMKPGRGRTPAFPPSDS